MTDSWEEQREGEVAFSWSKGGKLNELPRMPKGLDVKPRAYESQYLPHSGTRLEPEIMGITSQEQPEAAATSPSRRRLQSQPCRATATM